MQFELSFLHSELNRIIEMTRFADRKSAFLGVYYSIMFTVLFSQREKINSMMLNTEETAVFNFLLIAILILLFTGILFLIRSITPRLKNNFNNASLFYFGNILKMTSGEYLERMETITIEDAKKQIVEQIHINSIIMDQKLKSIQFSIKILFCLIVFIIILIGMLI